MVSRRNPGVFKFVHNQTKYITCVGSEKQQIPLACIAPKNVAIIPNDYRQLSVSFLDDNIDNRKCLTVPGDKECQSCYVDNNCNIPTSGYTNVNDNFVFCHEKKPKRMEMDSATNRYNIHLTSSDYELGHCIYYDYPRTIPIYGAFPAEEDRTYIRNIGSYPVYDPNFTIR